MERLSHLLKDEQYKRLVKEIELREQQRSFCRHDMAHLLDVARIAWILCLEQKLAFTRDCVYAAAFLHDIGREAEYDHPAADHAEAGTRLARPLLLRHGFSPVEAEAIAEAIREHRRPPQECRTALGRVLAAADDYSRRCFECPVRSGCYKFDRMPAAEGLIY